MKTWEYFYVRHCVKFAKPWKRKSGWAVWHDCFDYEYECRDGFVVQSEVLS